MVFRAPVAAMVAGELCKTNFEEHAVPSAHVLGYRFVEGKLGTWLIAEVVPHLQGTRSWRASASGERRNTCWTSALSAKVTSTGRPPASSRAIFAQFPGHELEFMSELLPFSSWLRPKAKRISKHISKQISNQISLSFFPSRALLA